MSYARLGEDSDVYVFLNGQGWLECGDCRYEPRYHTTADMLVHLDLHRIAGDRVPQQTFDRLLRDRAVLDAWIKKQRRARKGER